MARGRKLQGEEKRTEVISFRITASQKQALIKNPWIRNELKKDIDITLNAYKE